MSATAQVMPLLQDIGIDDTRGQLREAPTGIEPV
jgi:hypothetical protein